MGSTDVKRALMATDKQGNIESVKSIIIAKVIFSFLSYNKKLFIIQYNKKYQKIFDINNEDYKKLSGRYLIINNKGIGKIYQTNNNILIFQGKYLNGKKNGKGKEYYENGQLKFEGE